MNMKSCTHLLPLSKIHICKGESVLFLEKMYFFGEAKESIQVFRQRRKRLYVRNDYENQDSIISFALKSPWAKLPFCGQFAGT